MPACLTTGNGLLIVYTWVDLQRPDYCASGDSAFHCVTVRALRSTLLWSQSQADGSRKKTIPGFRYRMSSPLLVLGYNSPLVTIDVESYSWCWDTRQELSSRDELGEIPTLSLKQVVL